MTELKDVVHLYIGCEAMREKYKGIISAVLADKRMVVFRSSFAVAGGIVQSNSLQLILKPYVANQPLTPIEIVQLAKEGYDLFELIPSGQAIEYKETSEGTTQNKLLDV
jgi:hypothetical protein